MSVGGHAAPGAVVAVTVGGTLVACLVTVLRLFTRIAIVRKPGLDDLFIGLALFLSISVTVTMYEQVNYGMGMHYDTLTPSDKLHSTIWFWASVWLYYLGLCFTKISILLQYLRVFTNVRFRFACYGLLAVVAIYSIITAMSSFFMCTPIDRFWNRTVAGKCLNEEAVWFSNACLNIATDMATAILPLPLLSTLRLPKRQKLLLMLVFALGGFTCIISILRLYSLYVVSHTTDLSWNNPLPAIWSSLEINVGIFCSCMPTLKGLLARLFPGTFGSSTYERSTFASTSNFPPCVFRTDEEARDTPFSEYRLGSPLIYVTRPLSSHPVAPNFSRSGRYIASHASPQQGSIQKELQSSIASSPGSEAASWKSISSMLARGPIDVGNL